MYLGDQIVTSTGLNTTFRIYWLPEDSTTLSFVDRAIPAYLFTNRFDAHCPVNGGADPCQRADQRIVGAVLQRNTPSPHTLSGSGANQLSFFWNVREGNGFPLPYSENATFGESTLAYQSRRYVWSGAQTWFYAAAGANDRGHVALSIFRFPPAATGINPQHYVGIDDDYNGSPPGWQVFFVRGSTGVWTSSNSGDYLRARLNSPGGVGWIASGYTRDAATAQYRPHFVEFQRGRDNRGTTRFDQQ